MPFELFHHHCFRGVYVLHFKFPVLVNPNVGYPDERVWIGCRNHSGRDMPAS